MKTYPPIFFLSLALFAAPAGAQDNPRPARLPGRPATPAARLATNASGDYPSDLAVVQDGQAQALQQARQMLEQAEGVRDKTALETAIKEIERSQAALEQAKNAPDKLPAALAAEQAAYQALLKVTPREFRITRSRRGGQGGGQGGGNQRQIDQLEMQREENRYETERQATATKTPQQREQLQTADRLKELAQRQQDVNERLRDLQSALQAARTETERADLQRQLKRLQDEQSQLLSNVDELRQKLAESPNASSLSDARQQLDQTRSDMERAAQEMERQSASQALAAGTRAQQGMQNLRDDLRKQTSSQFSQQMRDMRNEARELSRQQDEIAKKLESLNSGDHQSLDNSAERKQIADAMTKQQNTLTNLLANMRTVTEQAETSEPLLSQQLYDTLRHAEQAQTDNLLQTGTQLVDRGFLPQASEVERSARTNLTELRQGVERAAESVLGSEADALRFAQKELDDLTRQVEHELGGGTNSAEGTNAAVGARATENNPSNGQRGAGEQAQNSQGEPGNAASSNRAGRSRPTESVSSDPSVPSDPSNQSDNTTPGNRGGRGNRSGTGQPTANTPGDSTSPPGTSDPANAGQGGNGAADRLREFTQQLGQRQNGGTAAPDGPITGNGYVNWADRMRDIESVLDAPDLRNQLATVRERVGAYRGNYRDRGQRVNPEDVKDKVLTPLTQVRVWLEEELARRSQTDSLVPLDRDPVPEIYSESVRKYYEKLGSAQ